MLVIMSASADFLRELRTAAVILGIAPTTLCQRAVSNGRLVRRLEAGGGVEIETVNKIRAYIASQAPAKPRVAPTSDSKLPQVTSAHV